MLYSIDDIFYNVEWNPANPKDRIPIIFFHGFTGSAKDWQFLENKIPNKFAIIIIDLLGHGKTSSPDDFEKYSFDNQIDQINKLFKVLEIRKPIIVGYSMGGRLALSYAMKYHREIRALVLESTSFGIQDLDDKENRIRNDNLLAKKISNSSLEEFVNYWMSIPLFDSLNKIPKENIEQLQKRKIASNNKMGLQNSLIGFGSGKMKNYYPVLNELNLQTLLIAGKLDLKYYEIAERVNEMLSFSELEIIKDCGHNVHLENPEEFLKLLNKFLLNIRDEK